MPEQPQSNDDSDHDVVAMFSDHCGGSGKIIMVLVLPPDDREELFGHFSSAEKAQAWADTFPDDYAVIISAHTVDNPSGERAH